jgi:hypothetical protein
MNDLTHTMRVDRTMVRLAAKFAVGDRPHEPSSEQWQPLRRLVERFEAMATGRAPRSTVSVTWTAASARPRPSSPRSRSSWRTGNVKGLCQGEGCQ